MNRASQLGLQERILIAILIIYGASIDLATWVVTVPSTPLLSPTPGPGEISIVTNDTKAEWLNLVTQAFNAQHHKTAAGHQIVVNVIQEGSPGPTVEKIVKGQLQPVLWSPGDISWVEQANLQLKDNNQQPIVTEECPPIAYIPTGFAMWRPMAEALGWPDKPIGWKQIVDLAGDPQGWARYGHPEWGQFKFGHSNPEQSTTGFNMLATLAYAAAGKTSGLTPEDVRSQTVMDAFRKVEQNTYHYGTSTSGLLTLMAKRGPSYLHAVTSSETAVIKTNDVQKDIMRFPYVFIFPAEGAFWMDNPTCILAAGWVSAEQREAAKIYRDYLLAPEQQDKAVQIGLRPAVAAAPLHAPIALENGTDPRVSPQTVPPLANVSGATAAAIIDAFKDTKKKATVVLVLDTSGSMVGEKIDSAAAATRNFVNRLAPEDEVQLLTFSDGKVRDFGQLGPASDVRAGLLRALERPFSGAYTPLNDAVCDAVASAGSARERDGAAGERRLYGVVVLTDGQENASTHKDVFACLPTGEDVDGIKVFTIAYGGDADKDQLKKIAERTNGKIFIGDPATIDQVYLAISAEQ
jgi:Ca-activated chloride channel family protein